MRLQTKGVDCENCGLVVEEVVTYEGYLVCRPCWANHAETISERRRQEDERIRSEQGNRS